MGFIGPAMASDSAAYMSQALYKQITDLIPKLHGWCDVSKGITLCNMVLATKPSLVVEIGTWGGRSLFPMALALKQTGGTAIVIDPWNPEASAQGQVTDLDEKWWKEMANHELVYQHFIYHLKELGLEHLVQINRAKSEEVEPPKNIGLFHCDGNHGPQAYTDVTRFAPNIVPWGICVLDDCSWHGGHVQRAGEWLLSNGFIALHDLGTGRAYLKIG